MLLLIHRRWVRFAQCYVHMFESRVTHYQDAAFKPVHELQIKQQKMQGPPYLRVVGPEPD